MFSGLHARCEFKKASVCERNDLKLKGYGLLGSEERCHCVGDRSSITERCEVGSMVAVSQNTAVEISVLLMSGA